MKITHEAGNTYYIKKDRHRHGCAGRDGRLWVEDLPGLAAAGVRQLSGQRSCSKTAGMMSNARPALLPALLLAKPPVPPLKNSAFCPRAARWSAAGCRIFRRCSFAAHFDSLPPAGRTVCRRHLRQRPRHRVFVPPGGDPRAGCWRWIFSLPPWKTPTHGWAPPGWGPSGRYWSMTMHVWPNWSPPARRIACCSILAGCPAPTTRCTPPPMAVCPPCRPRWMP